MLMRYFARIAYRGTHYFGWQRQPNQRSVQQVIEEALTLLLGHEIAIVGCGRTDAGVHASEYYLHFDTPQLIPNQLAYRLNKYLPDDIVFYGFYEMEDFAHARFDAYERSYEYHLRIAKNPFDPHLAYYFPQGNRLDFVRMNQACELLLSYEEFLPFCKTDHNANTLKCEMKRIEWVKVSSDKYILYVTANRFLRGMIRLIVGMSLNIGLDKTSIEEVRIAMDKQTRLKRSLSVPPQGLFLKGIKYPTQIFKSTVENVTTSL